MSKYLDPRYDLTFKAVFEHPDLIISFLNALLPFKNGEVITEVEYLPVELTNESPFKKFSIVDVRCKDQNGRQFLVEMQMYWTDEFKQRVLFNASKAYVKQADQSVDYKTLQPVYSLNIVNDRGFDGNEYFHQFQLAEKGNPDRIIEGIELVFVELKKFKPQTIAEHTMKRLWLRFLTEINEKTQEVPQELLESPEICKAMAIVERGAYTESQINAYEKYWDTISAEITLLNGHYRKGKAEGLKEGEEIGLKKGEEIGLKKGEEKGAHKEKLDNARKMKDKGYPVEDIAEITGLSKDDIEKLL
ncbi:MAG: Rpn family recombination-promoting nuclease/putative transposase [Paludibacteraceae bacterium]|nr:Rpn family recombination-promoting nuclease/putative transposase [Candidatus Physcocola equi]MCQ2234468.1 Rpn family recombination-promoting nuclease/putative transposase [Paludibacteraceae bacterium]